MHCLKVNRPSPLLLTQTFIIFLTFQHRFLFNQLATTLKDPTTAEVPKLGAATHFRGGVGYTLAKPLDRANVMKCAGSQCGGPVWWVGLLVELNKVPTTFSGPFFTILEAWTLSCYFATTSLVLTSRPSSRSGA